MVWLFVAVLPVVLLLINLVFPVPLVREKNAAIPLALMMAVGAGNAMMADRKIRRSKPQDAEEPKA